MATFRPRNTKIPFDIHQDQSTEEEVDDGEHREMEESRGEEDEDDTMGQDYDSDESDLIVDPVVQEDMDRFKETFQGIKERFRLINRIGEGIFIFLLQLA